MKPFKIIPEMLPAGTVVEYQVSFMKEPKTVIVAQLCTNGIGSSLFEIKDSYNDLTGGPEVINIAWITKIIKRGDGGMKYRTGPRHVLYSHRSTIHSGYIMGFYLSSYLSHMLPAVRGNGFIHGDALLKAFKAQHTSVPMHVGESVYPAYKKSVFRTWVKANVNRFLTTKKERKIEEHIDSLMDEWVDVRDRFIDTYSLEGLYGCKECRSQMFSRENLQHYGILSRELVEHFEKYKLPYYEALVTAENGDAFHFFTDKENFGKEEITRLGDYTYSLRKEFVGGSDTIETYYDAIRVLQFLNGDHSKSTDDHHNELAGNYYGPCDDYGLDASDFV